MDGCSRQNPAYRPAVEGGSRPRGPLSSPSGHVMPDLRPRYPDRTVSSHVLRRQPVAAVRRECEHVFALIVCVLIPRFALAVAAGGRDALAAGPVAVAPEPGRDQLIGEASAAAEAYGVRAGVRLGEALARCPTLRLVAPDPAGVADAWDGVLCALEGIGAAVESDRAGAAWFSAGGLKNLHGGSLDGVLAATRNAVRGPLRLGAAPSRFAALAAAGRARAR